MKRLTKAQLATQRRCELDYQYARGVVEGKKAAEDVAKTKLDNDARKAEIDTLRQIGQLVDAVAHCVRAYCERNKL